jgi:serine/threonine protein kinase
MGCSSSTGVTASVEHNNTDAFKLKPVEPIRPPRLPCEHDGGKHFHEQYVLLRKLGKGAFARVYSCQPSGGEGSHMEFAVKITDLRAHTRGQEPSNAVDARMKRAAEKEASVLRKIGEQQYCCGIIDSLFGGYFHYMILEKCSLTLLQALERLPELTERSLVNTMKEMFLGIEAVHLLRVVHRDIKPDNFLCSGPNSTVKLCDFGLAEVIPEKSTGVSGVNGTAPFMSPEMLAGVKYAFHTDIWSLGVLLYVLLMGQFPYIPAESNAKAMKAAISSGIPEPGYKSTVKDISHSSDVISLTKSCLHRNAAARPSATEVLQHRWFIEGSTWKGQSLRAVLSSAKRVGAFDVRNGTGNGRLDAIDKELKEMQSRFQSSAKSTETTDTRSQDAK